MTRPKGLTQSSRIGVLVGVTVLGLFALAALLAPGAPKAEVRGGGRNQQAAIAETASLAAAAANALAEERWAAAADLCRACAAAYRTGGDERGEVLCLLGAARAELQRGNHEPALGALQQVLAALNGNSWGTDLEVSGQLLFAESYRDRQLYDDAAIHLERGLALSRAIRDRFSEAAFLERLGFIETLRDRWREAEQYLRAASTLADEVSATDVSALSLRHLAHLKQSQGRFREAAELLAKAAELARLRNSPGDEASSLQLLGSVDLDLYKYEEALVELRKAEALLVDEKPPVRLWVARKEIGEALAALGKLPEALALDEEVIEHYRSLNDEVRLPAVLAAAARVLARQGRSQEQRAYLEEALCLRRHAKDRRGEAEILNELGHLEFQRNSYEEGLKRFEEALALFRSIHSKTGEMKALFNTAHLYFDLGRPEEARIRYEQVLRMARELDSYLVEASVLRDLARLSIYEGRGDEALVRIEEASMLARQTGSPPDEIDALKLKGDALGRCGCGRDHEAFTAFSEALALSTQSPDPQARLNVLLSIGRLQLSQGNPAAATRTLEEVLAGRRSVYSQLQESVVLTLLANAYQDLGQNEHSIELYRQALAAEDAILDRTGTDDFLLHQERHAAEAASPLIQLLVAAGREEEAFAVAENARSRAFLRQLRDRPLDLRRSVDSELLAEESRLRGALREVDREIRSEQRKPFEEQDRTLLEGLYREVDEARQRYGTLLIRLKQTNPELASLRRPAPLSLPAVQRLLAGETTLVEYFVLLDQTIVWVIDLESSHLVRLPLPAQRLYEKVALWRSGVMARATGAELESDLYRDLVAPLEPYLRHRSLLIVPHESLQWLSFAALRDPGGSALIERFSLAYLPSASILPFLAAKRSPNAGVLLAMGDPDGSLPHAAAEARAVAALYGAQALLGRDATEAALRERSRGVDVLHIATHSTLDSARPLFSRLQLAPSAEDDGNFELHEVFGLDLAGTNLVVLSGCDTGRGSLRPGDEIVGWSRAFLHAGAPAVLATLWPIDDAASAALMTSFHRRFRQGLSAAESLRAAQREIANEERWRSPYFWSAYTLAGDTGGSGVPDEHAPQSAPASAPRAAPGPASAPAGKPLAAREEESSSQPAVSLEISAAQAFARQRWQEAATLCRQCADKYREAGDLQGEAFCLLGLGLARRKIGQERASADALLEGLVASGGHRRQGDLPLPHHLLMAEVYLALPLHYEEAVAHLDAALRLARSQQDRFAEALVLSRLGSVALKRGQLEEAAEPLEAGLAIARQDRLEDLLAGLLYDLAVLASKQGRAARAAELLTEAAALAHRRSQPDEEAASLQLLGSAHLALHQPDRALETLARAESLLTEKDDTDTLWAARKDMAQALACQGELPKALALYDRVIEHYRVREEEWWNPSLLTAAADALGRQGRPGEQRAYLERALRIWRQLGHKIGEADILNQLGILQLSWGSLGEALESFEEALEAARSVKGRRSEGEALLNSARVFLGLGRDDEARSRYEQALAIARELSNAVLEASVLEDLVHFPASGRLP